MKQQISGPVGAIIVVVVVGILIFFGYTMFMKPPGQITPQEMQKNMAKGMAQQQQQSQRRGPGGNMPAPGSGGAAAPSGQ